MKRSLQLAKKGINTVAPNPMVGCVITIPDETAAFGERIIGEGYHKEYGGPHAEVNAIDSVAGRLQLRQATVYVSLEPCSHFGKTPPCANLLVECGVKKVVVACLDPNPAVAGNGLARLEAAGIETVVNVLQTEAEELNRRFITFHTKKRPYVILKWAETQNGYVANADGSPKWISNPRCRQLVHKWRSETAAIMAGSQTIINDNPTLNSRDWAGPSPVRVVTDWRRRLAEGATVLSDGAKTLIYNSVQSKVAESVEYVKVAEHDIRAILTDLHKRNLNSLFVEGGSTLLQQFINQNLWDETYVFIGDGHIEKGVGAPVIANKDFDQLRIDNNILKTYRQ